ncbi:MAG: amidase [Pseudomonadota bacterium]|nr:amidase [Pseudomonadota bacterium]
MTPDTPLDRPAAELAQDIRDKRLSPVELTEALLRRIEALQPVLNCFITIAGDEAMESARAAEAMVMAGKPLGPAHGLPFTVKDMVRTRGVRTTYGSLTRKDNIPDVDDLAVARLKRAGAILIGKTTAPEFAHAPMTQSPLFGKTRNPWNRNHTPGGSSGGGATAIAAGLSLMSVESDSGGSVRIPASCCGTVGLKQSSGLLPDDTSLDVFNAMIYVNPMARTTGDLAFMMDLMKGGTTGDPFSVHLAIPNFSATLDNSSILSGMRIAVLPPPRGTRVDPEVQAAVEAAVAVLEDRGAIVDRDTGGLYPDDDLWDRSVTAWGAIQGSLRLHRYGESIKAHRDLISPSFLKLIEGSEALTAMDLQTALFTRTEVFHRVQSWFDDHDLIVMPTLTRTALSVDHDLDGRFQVDGAWFDMPMKHWFPNCHIANMSGHPALSVPCGFGAGNLPIGLQVMAPHGRDHIALACAAQIEAALHLTSKRPDFTAIDV